MKIYTKDSMVNPVRLYNCTYRGKFNREQLDPIHIHKGCAELFLCIKGSANHYINRTKQPLSEGSLVFIRAGDVHGYMDPMSEDFQILNIRYDEQVLADLGDYLGKDILNKKLLSPDMPPSVVLPKVERSTMRQKMEKLFFPPKFDPDVIRLMFKIFLVHIVSDYLLTPQNIVQGTIPTWMQVVLNEMSRPKNYITGVKAIYDISCKCQDHVCREFKKYLKKTPTQVVNEIRLEEAAKQLVFTEDKVINICDRVGFDNLSHFHHQFKKMYSMSPLEFRLKATEKEIV